MSVNLIKNKINKTSVNMHLPVACPGSPGTPASFTTKTGCHDIAEILPKVALSTKNQSINQSFNHS
jgi:hypothetical protein